MLYAYHLVLMPLIVNLHLWGMLIVDSNRMRFIQFAKACLARSAMIYQFAYGAAAGQTGA